MLSCHFDELDTPLVPDDEDTSEIYDAVVENFLAEVRCSLENQIPTHRLPGQSVESL